MATAKQTRNKQSNRPKKVVKKAQAKKKRPTGKTSARKLVRRAESVESSWNTESAFSAIESGDLEGLSRTEQDDSESVDELLEEGNAFEAEAVSGVEEADSEDERGVHTHEVPEDDVPDEYLDKE